MAARGRRPRQCCLWWVHPFRLTWCVRSDRAPTSHRPARTLGGPGLPARPIRAGITRTWGRRPGPRQVNALACSPPLSAPGGDNLGGRSGRVRAETTTNRASPTTLLTTRPIPGWLRGRPGMGHLPSSNLIREPAPPAQPVESASCRPCRYQRSCWPWRRRQRGADSSWPTPLDPLIWVVTDESGGPRARTPLHQENWP